MGKGREKRKKGCVRQLVDTDGKHAPAHPCDELGPWTVVLQHKGNDGPPRLLRVTVLELEEVHVRQVRVFVAGGQTAPVDKTRRLRVVLPLACVEVHDPGRRALDG